MTIIKVNGQDIEIHGPKELSVGGQNRYYFFCDYYGQRRAYGGCIHLLDAEVKPVGGTPDELTCWKAMQSDRCKAKTMRALEEAVDGSVFYSPRRGTIDHPFADETVLGEVLSKDYKQTESYLRGWNQVGRALNKPDKPVSTPKTIEKKVEQTPEPKIKIEQGTLADAINKQMGELRNDA
jgi:hypothetical protein